MPSRGFLTGFLALIYRYLFLDVNDPLAEWLNSLADLEDEMQSRGFLTGFLALIPIPVPRC